MRRIEVSDTTIAEISKMLADGSSKKSVCERFGISNDVLYRIQAENNICGKSDESNRFTLSDEKQKILYASFENTDLTLRQISNNINCDYFVMLRYLREKYGQSGLDNRKARLYSISKSGSNNPHKNLLKENSTNWKGGHPDDGSGYTLVFDDDNWMTTHKANEYVYEHQLTFLKALGLHKMPNNFVIHHIDLDKKNNEIDNLAFLTNSAHARLHSILRNHKINNHPEDLDNQLTLDEYLGKIGLTIHSYPSEFTSFCVDMNVYNYCLSNVAIVTIKGLNSITQCVVDSLLY